MRKSRPSRRLRGPEDGHYLNQTGDLGASPARSVTSVNSKSDTSDIKRRVEAQNSRKHGRSTILDAGTSHRSREM